MFNKRNILITGGTGSFGKQMVKTILERYEPNKLIVFSRDELKQSEMAQEFPQDCMRFFIGDVRDKNRLHEALYGVDYVIHAAALKQVPSCEYNPFEAIQTNVLGAQNVIRACIARGVGKVIALSTDKAANPINLYGASKLCSDKLFIAGNVMSGNQGTAFSVVRYGNVVNSRGSVIPFFMKEREKGVIPITHPEMTRFLVTIERGVDFTLDRFDCMGGGEIFVPRIPSATIMTIKEAVAPNCETETVGIRPGEKLHEVLVPVDEARNTIGFHDHYTIHTTIGISPTMPEGFCYASNTNKHFLSVSEIRKLANIEV